MKRITGILVALALIAGTSVGAFAAGSSEVKDYKFIFGSQKVADQRFVGHAEVEVPQSVKDYFSANGFGDASFIGNALTDLTQDQKDDIDAFILDDDHKSDIDALVRPALRAALVRGETETATVRIGRIQWSLNLVGPEDENQ